MMNRMGILLGCFLLAAPANGQEAFQPIAVGQSAEIESRVLNESRRVYVATPPSYEQSEERYGVLYVLDGDWNFHHTVATTQFLGGFATQMIPPLVVVGIGNTNRMRDMTPASAAQENRFLAQGEAGRFLEFIVEELKPWVDERYRTIDYSVLIGHSLGGLFAVHTMITRPDSFDSFLVMDPSLNWNSQALVREADAFITRDSGLSASLFLAVSGNERSELDGVRRFAGILGANAPDGLRWTLAPFVAESHDSIPLPGTYQGLQWIFSDWHIEAQAEAMFSDAPGEEIFGNIDDLYRQSGERFSMARETPYVIFESLLGYLAENGRIDEAAELTLRHSDRYPLPLVPNVIAGIAQLFVDSGDEGAAIDYLSAVLELYPGNETARKALLDLGVHAPTE